MQQPIFLSSAVPCDFSPSLLSSLFISLPGAFYGFLNYLWNSSYSPLKKEYHSHGLFHPEQLQQKWYYHLLQFLLPMCHISHLTALELSKANCGLLVHPTNNSISHLVISIFLCSQIPHFLHLWCCEYWPLNVHSHYAK